MTQLLDGTQPLAPEVVRPTSHHRTRSFQVLAVMSACGLVGTAIAASVVSARMSTRPVEVEVVEVCAMTPTPLVAPTIAAEPAPVEPVVVPAPKSIGPRAGEVKLVFQSGGATYMKLAKLASPHDDDMLAEPMPKHGAPKLLGGKTVRDNEGDWANTTIASVKELDIPVAYRAWKGREVAVDGLCRAKVTGFAVVSRLTGEPAYANGETDSDEWTAKSVMDNGARMLVARLDNKCKGTLARDVSLPPIATMALSQEPKLLAAGRAALLASELGQQAKQDWKANDQKGNWYDEREYDGATFNSHVVRHPITNETFVSVHATLPFGCGTTNVNAWGLYRVGSDGKLTKVVERSLELHKIDAIVDLEGDGELELIGKPMFDEAGIERQTGGAVEWLELPYLGCAC